MAILSGWKSFEKYIKKIDGYQLMSERTNARDVLFDNNTNLSDKIGEKDISKIGDGSLTGAITYLQTNFDSVKNTQSDLEQTIPEIQNSIKNITSDIDNIKSVRLGGLTFRVVSQAQYNSLPSASKNNNTVYIIVG